VAISPDYWPKARTDAPIHLQLKLTKRPEAYPDHVVAGKIVRIFRDETRRLRRGSRLSFTIHWFDERAPRDPNPGPPILEGQRFALLSSWLEAARYLEVYLAPVESEPGGYDVVWDQATAMRRATSQPVNPAEAEGYGVFVTDEVRRHAAALPQPWWRRWLPRAAKSEPS